MRVTVLGAGYMGSAMATVAKKRGHDVTLWGTWLDDPMLDPVSRGEKHPRLQLTLDGIAIMRSADLERALTDAEMVVCGVNSDGVAEVMKRAKSALPNVPVLSVTKGLIENHSKKIERIDLVVSEVLGRDARFVHAAGPAKAMEVARDVFTWMFFGGKDAADAAFCAKAMRGDRLVVTESTDIAGAELCSALKNAYATGIGMWDGFVGPESHNARAACFAQSIVEMREIVVRAGGHADTANGCAGVGDLHVTAAAGRNRAFGERIGRGEPAKEVASDMLAKGLLTEGYAAIATATRFAEERGMGNLPFLKAIDAIVWRGADVKKTLSAFTF